MISDERLAQIRAIDTWQKLMDDDPMDIVVTLRDEVERLRAENAQLLQARDFHFNAANDYCAKLAKAKT